MLRHEQCDWVELREYQDEPIRGRVGRVLLPYEQQILFLFDILVSILKNVSPERMKLLNYVKEKAKTLG